ncbi:hypothetical protein GOP47_0031104 [Adiantum capillus-veneris]|nr:hypothetical protein GOP47_0031104 [Adiantum capillus-veneris]
MRKEDTITLVSAEGFEFVIDRKAAVISNTLKSMLSSAGGFKETGSQASGDKHTGFGKSMRVFLLVFAVFQ